MPGIYLWPADSIANSQSLASGRLASAAGLHQALCTPDGMHEHPGMAPALEAFGLVGGCRACWVKWTKVGD